MFYLFATFTLMLEEFIETPSFWKNNFCFVHNCTGCIGYSCFTKLWRKAKRWMRPGQLWFNWAYVRLWPIVADVLNFQPRTLANINDHALLAIIIGQLLSDTYYFCYFKWRIALYYFLKDFKHRLCPLKENIV